MSDTAVNTRPVSSAVAVMVTPGSAALVSSVTAPAMDAVLHPARLARAPDGATHHARAAALPDGAMILHAGRPALILGPRALPFAPSGYGAPLPRPVGDVAVLTPAPIVAVLRAGYRPALHPSATG